MSELKRETLASGSVAIIPLSEDDNDVSIVGNPGIGECIRLNEWSEQVVLTREQCRLFWPVLKRFAETGQLPEVAQL